MRYQIITDLQAMLDAFDSRQIDVIPTLSRAEAEDRMNNKDVVITRAPSRFYPVIHFKITRASRSATSAFARRSTWRSIATR